MPNWNSFTTTGTRVQSNLAKGRFTVLSPLMAAPSNGGSGPHLIHGSLDQHESAPRQHLDRLSRFAQLTHVPNRQTHRHL